MIYADTDGLTIRLENTRIELTEQNIWRYVIPYVNYIQKDTLLMHMITKGYFGVVRYLVEVCHEDILYLYVRMSEVHGHTEMTTFLKKYYVEEEILDLSTFL